MHRSVAGGAGRSHRFSGDHFVVAARAAVDPDSPRLTMAISKKLVPSSPVRNLMRRVIRESHLQACRTHSTLFGALGELTVRVQLIKCPVDPIAPMNDSSGRTVRPFVRRPTDRVLKQRVRHEMDTLFRRLASRAAVHAPSGTVGSKP